MTEHSKCAIGQDFLNFIFVFSLFRTYIPLEKALTLYMYKHAASIRKNALCQVWLKLVQCILEEDFLNSSTYFRYFLISLWKREGPFI